MRSAPSVLFASVVLVLGTAGLPAQRMPPGPGNSGFAGVDPRSREPLFGPATGSKPTGCRLTGVG